MTQILADAISSVSFTNGVLRIDCVTTGPKQSEHRFSGTILIPANQAGPVLKALVDATKELERRHIEQREKGAAKTQ